MSRDTGLMAATSSANGGLADGGSVPLGHRMYQLLEFVATL